MVVIIELSNYELTKEYHFYISDDHTHDTFLFSIVFYLLYEGLMKRGVNFKEH
jgi:hypothetical protein